jgi:hypothetical protein
MRRFAGYAVALLVLAAGLRWWDTLRNVLPDSSSFKNVIEALAVLLAGCFFGYKALTGYLRTNMSLSVKARRYAFSPDGDRIKVTIFLKKGPSGTVTLHDAAPSSRGTWELQLNTSCPFLDSTDAATS